MGKRTLRQIIVASLALSGLIVLIMLFEFLFYREFTDPFYKKATSHNIYCVRKPSGETKRRIILAGHADSSIEWTPTHVGGSGFLYFTFAYGFLGLVYQIVVSVLALAKPDLGPTAASVLMFAGCAFLPGHFLLIFFMNYKVCVEGANDNLSGCMTAAAVMKFMGDNDLRFENTELVVMFSGAEEAGLRGAKAAVKQHPEFKDGGVETVFVSFDTLKDYP